MEELFDRIDHKLKIDFFNGKLDYLISDKFKNLKLINRIWIVGGAMDDIQNRLNSLIIPLSTETDLEIIDIEMFTKKELKYLKKRYKFSFLPDPVSLTLYRPKQIELYFMFGEN
jgi:hypothetical protein